MTHVISRPPCSPPHTPAALAQWVQRAFTLPTTVDQEEVQATGHDGVLELRLPKAEAAKPKRIAING